MRKLQKIFSGGQTGVDRAGLDAAIAHGFPCGGWCPEGRLAEDGPIPAHYPLTVLPGSGYEERTLKNLIDSDGTLVIYFNILSGGTLETLEWCRNRSIPALTVDAARLNTEQAAQEVEEFLTKKEIVVLNVAGPRASKQIGAYDFTFALISDLIAARRKAL